MDGIDIKMVPPLTEDEYYPRGSTALLVAIGKTILRIDEKRKKLPGSMIPAKTIFAIFTIFTITTDGHENSSREFSCPDIKRMIEAHKEMGWEFIFIGANIDSVTVAEGMGIDASRSVNYHADSVGQILVFEALHEAVRTTRRRKRNASNKLNEANWREKLDADYYGRGGNQKKGNDPDHLKDQK